MQASDWHLTKDGLPDEFATVVLYSIHKEITVGHRYGTEGGECWWAERFDKYCDLDYFPKWFLVAEPEDEDASK